jgi:small subunit ribosomal protein S3
VGQKVHPIGFRLGIIKESQARWYAEKKGFTQYLQEDLKVRGMIMSRLADAGVSKVEIERSANQMTVTIHAAKPGIVIGKSGVKVEELRRNLESTTAKKVRVTIQEIRQPELEAYLVARSVAEQLEKRVAFRRAMKQAVGRAMRFGAKGVRVQISGRLGGAEMSRRESDRDGRVPLHTLRADIDFGIAEAMTTYGVIGVKVWVYKGEILPASREPAAGTVAGRPAAARPIDRSPLPGDGPLETAPEPAPTTAGIETVAGEPSVGAALEPDLSEASAQLSPAATPAPQTAPAPTEVPPGEPAEAALAAGTESLVSEVEAVASQPEVEAPPARPARSRRATANAKQPPTEAPSETPPAVPKKPRAARSAKRVSQDEATDDSKDASGSGGSEEV